jgi:hypothetical protein
MMRIFVGSYGVFIQRHRKKMAGQMEGGSGIQGIQ